MIRIAVHQITIAPTEQAVINAGVTVHRPGRDLSDQVVDAIEQRIAELRTPPGWLHRLPPPLPSWFDAARAVEAAYNGQPTASFMAAMPSLTPAMGAFGATAAMGAGGAAGTMGAAGSAATRMGMGALRPGNLPRSRTRSSRFQPRRPAPQPPRFPEWTPPANTQPGMINPFTLLSSSFSGAMSNPSQTAAQTQTNPSQTGAQPSTNTAQMWLQALMNPSQTGSPPSQMSLLDLLSMSHQGTNVVG